MPRKACVVGAGVVGVTAGMRLLEAGWHVTLIADNTTPFTTSDGSAAIWFPFLAQPLDKVIRWSKISYDILVKEAESPDAAWKGVEMRSGYEFYTKRLEKDPDFSSFVRDYRRVTYPELPAKYADGIFCSVPVAAMTSYMRHLTIRFQQQGGKMVLRHVENLAALANSGEFDLVVNCTGLAARQLLCDHRVRPLRGHVMRVYAPSVRHFYFDENDPDNMTYIIPRNDLVVMGGTAQMDDFCTSVRESETAGIIQRCSALEPALATAPVVTHWVGLRPFRDSVRLELERDVMTNGAASGSGDDAVRVPVKVPVIHNYGHGGSGVTIAWGCAADVVALAEQAVPAKATARL